ncbi:hypothetical protein CL6EHI_193640 [Entamoeba histolytica]|uniref:Capsid protein n=2 Tax=Entamoeba histolytica TaxID=5759 RepID=C4MAZ3_ENTH1|nr:hypothetical protein EHI_193640 [Entamoeba histolytica HM-1:IMSS]EAL43368.2 hypothetical protein EHI_193640 [Entamoeba histolytica HM-1:IMSS]GAT99047.1 hypothetical protein CL6EHI_193640 [Entamoeba histolytica]|eukprot:XP_648753.2 hypothetical protein EHI_193640 [Entamoeba histolytica HM-1:IMSS]
MARLKKRTTRRKTSKRPTVRRGRRVYKRRVYRKRRRYYRRRRLLSQPNTVKLKSKLVCSIVEFIAIPERDSLPQILTMAAYPSNNGIAVPVQEAVLDFNILGQKFMTVQSVDTANSILRTEQIALSPPIFVAWNPYLDHNVMGNLWDSYCDMYDYWKFSGVKVKWIPKVKTSVALPYMPKNPVQRLNAFDYDKYATGLPYYPQVTFNMHVLFEKDNYYSMELPTDPESMDYTLTCKDTRYKLKNFDYGPNKPKTYKVYDMTKPFKFYVKPYLEDKVDEITNNQDSTQTGITITDKLDQQISKRKLMRYIKMNGTKKTYPVDNPTNKQKYSYSIQDVAYFDPILFGYFFTANGIEVSDKLTIAKASPPQGNSTLWNGYSLYTTPIISGIGRFELTFYTKFKQIKNKYLISFYLEIKLFLRYFLSPLLLFNLIKNDPYQYYCLLYKILNTEAVIVLPFKQLHPYLKNPWTEDINDRCPIMLVCQDCFWRCTVQGGCEYICNNKYFVKEKTGTD